MPLMHIVKKAILWKYHKLKNGELTVKIRIAYLGNTTYLKTGLTSKMEHWDESAGMPKPNHPKFRELVRRIDEVFENIDFELFISKTSIFALPNGFPVAQAVHGPFRAGRLQPSRKCERGFSSVG